MSTEKPDRVPEIPDIFNVDYGQLAQLGGTLIRKPEQPVSKEPEEITNESE